MNFKFDYETRLHHCDLSHDMQTLLSKSCRVYILGDPEAVELITEKAKKDFSESNLPYCSLQDYIDLELDQAVTKVMDSIKINVEFYTEVTL